MRGIGVIGGIWVIEKSLITSLFKPFSKKIFCISAFFDEFSFQRRDLVVKEIVFLIKESK